MEIIFGFALAALLNLGAVATSIAVFSRQLRAEKRYHLVLTEAGPEIRAGERRTPLKQREAQRQLLAIKKASRTLGWSWALSYCKLYGPRRNSTRSSALELMQAKAISSQRSALLLTALRKGFQDEPIMAVIMQAETDESFEILESKLGKASPGLPLSISAEEAKIVLPEEGAYEPLVLMDFKKGSFARELNRPEWKELSPNENSPKGVKLPDGYEWKLAFENRGRSFEAMVVRLVNSKGTVIASNNFYTSVYGTPEKQTKQILEIQQELAYSARHDMSPTGVDPALERLL